jgi:pyruvate/2-oxoglutarate dehydrogenase complex dihydrolipoamide dehydrogenase (E3) component
VADYLADQGYQIDLVEQSTAAATDLTNTRRVFLLERLKKNGVRLILGAKVLEINLPCIKVAVGDKQEILDNYNALVYAVGRQPNNELQATLQKSALPAEVFTIGDASSPRTALEAIHEAALLAAEI